MVFVTARLGGPQDLVEGTLLCYLLEGGAALRERGVESGIWGCGILATHCAQFHFASAAVVAGFAFD